MALCPVCHEPMVQVEENQVVAYSCPGCHGTWISTTALARRSRIESAPDQPHMDLPPLPDLAATVTQSNSTADLACPACTHTMIKQRFNATIPVQVDRCKACGFIWLDAGEQALLLQLYRELVATKGPIAARQQNLDRLQSQPPPQGRPSTTVTTTTTASGSRGMEIALNVGGAVVSILLDLLLDSGHHHRYGRW